MIWFQYPWMLCGLLPVAIVFGRVWRRKYEIRRRKVAAWLALAAALLLAAASQPRLTVSWPAKTVDLIVDDTASSATAFFRNPRTLRILAQSRLTPGVHIHVVLLGRRLRPLSGSPSIQTGAANHIHWSALVQARLRSPVWLFTSPYQHWPLHAPVKAMAVTIFHPRVADIGIRSLRAHRSPQGDVNVGMVISADGPVKAQLKVWRNTVLIYAENIRFIHRGGRVISLVDPHPPQGRLLTYRVRLESPDPWPGDNAADVVLPPRRSTRLLWVSGEKPKVSGIRHLHVISPSALPTEAANLGKYQGVVLDNVSSRDLNFAQAFALKKWVQDDFGGLTIIGASRAFGAGGYADSGAVSQCLNSLSPLSSHPPRRTPPGVVFFVDASGSMGRIVADTGGRTRFDLAAEGIADAMRTLGAGVRVTVLAFSGRTIRIPGRTPDAIDHALAGVSPNGPTRPDSALPMLRDVLRRHDWIILLTDGAVPKLSPESWGHLLQSTQSRMVIIAARQSRAIRHFVRRSHVRFVHAADERNWHLLLRRAARRVLHVSMKTQPLPWGTFPAARLALSGTTHAWIRTYLRRRTIALAGNRAKNIALAAYWRVGLGKVAAMAMNLDSPSSADLLRQLLYLSASVTANRNWQVELRRRSTNAIGGIYHGLQMNGGTNLWQLRVQTDKARGFSARLTAFLFVQGRRLLIPVPAVGPGVFESYFRIRQKAFAITVVRTQRAGNPLNRVRLIARAWPSVVPGPWFPATGTASLPHWKGCALIDRESPHPALWRPTVRRRFAAGNWLDIAAAACLFGAMLTEIFGRTPPANV